VRHSETSVRHSRLEEIVALLEATLESTHDAIIVTDLNRRIVRSNQHYLDMFGFTRDELLRGGVDLVLDVLLPQLEDADALAAKSRTIWEHPDREVFDVLRFKDGRVFERCVAPQRIGSTIVGLVASFRDISQSAHAQQALELHRILFEKAQEVAHVGSWVAELDGSDRLGWSAETHRIFGVPPGQFDGTAETFFSLIHDADRAVVRAASLAAVEGRAAYNVEHRIVRRDGSERWVHERADVLRGDHGEPIRMVGAVQDITDRRQLEDQLRHSQKMEAVGRLAGGIAHDLNNALTAIAGYAELALGQVPDDHPVRDDLDEIRRAAERASSVTRHMLEFSRKRLLEPRVFSLNEIVMAVARMLSRLLGSDVEVGTRLQPALPPILGDPGHVEQAIINLALNARDAMPNGGRLDLATRFDIVDETSARTHVPMTPGRYVVLSVTDTGHGMTREIQNRVFEPFFTTKDVGKGTGLGLSMVYGTLKQIGGFVFVDSEVGRGTEFSLYFPPVPAHALPAALPIAEGKRGGSETLLVVEDEAAVRTLVASALGKAGYRVLIASSAEEALKIADGREGEIDLLLTDAMMPGQSGIDLARALISRRPDLPVVLMSGYTEETLPLDNVEERFSLLHKPFTPRELRQRIREVLDR
jgi:two-component system cell cycle sensor histidine kinase/response regulator CckA